MSTSVCYSGDPKSDPSKTGNIKKLDKLKIGIQPITNLEQCVKNLNGLG